LLPVGVLALAAFTVQRLALNPAADVRVLLQSLSALAIEGLLVAPVWVLAVLRKKGGWSAVGFRRFNPLLGFTLPLAYLIVAFIGEGLWGAVIHLMNWPTQRSMEPIFGGNPAGIAIGFVAIAIVGPIAEETFFRGFIIGGLRRRFGTIGALLISALFFSLLHPPYTIFPIIVLLGTLLGLLYLQTGSLWPGILMHGLFNCVAFIAQFALNQNQ
jgi:membrane protease YdiL (CAAX protease family)